MKVIEEVIKEFIALLRVCLIVFEKVRGWCKTNGDRSKALGG